MASADMNMRVSVVETDQLDRLKQQMDRIEFKLDQLLDALAGDAGGDDEDEGAVHSLDGTVVSRPRNADESLG